MIAALTQQLTLEGFFKLPNLEKSPALEYLDGDPVQKPIPKFRHSLLQKRLLNKIDASAGNYLALPELRCTFGGRSIVPDIVVLCWNKIEINELGEPEDNFMEAPDWCIEILSPDQSTNRVIDNLLHCLHHGSKLGWLIDPSDYSVHVLTPQEEVKVYRGTQELPVLSDSSSKMTALEIFSWLKLR